MAGGGGGRQDDEEEEDRRFSVLKLRVLSRSWCVDCLFFEEGYFFRGGEREGAWGLRGH